MLITLRRGSKLILRTVRNCAHLWYFQLTLMAAIIDAVV